MAEVAGLQLRQGRKGGEFVIDTRDDTAGLEGRIRRGSAGRTSLTLIGLNALSR